MVKNLRVSNVIGKNGKAVPNQFYVHYTEGNDSYVILQSYDSMILKMKDWEIVEVGKDWDFSRTTGKYRNIATGMDKKAFKKMLDEEFIFNEETQSYHRR